MLNSEELKEVKERVFKKIGKQMDIENRTNGLPKYLETLDCGEFINKHIPYVKNAKILVFGNSEISEQEMRQIAIENGINPKNLVFELDYKKNKHFDFSTLKYNTGYSDIIFGQIAHKGVRIGGYSSAIAMMEKESEYYPNVVRASDNLKISHSSFRNAITRTQAYKDLIGY